MSYKYETHLHTSESSLCSGSTAAELVKFYSDLGYAGIFVSDHLYKPATVKMEGQPWEKLIARQCAGYDAAVAAAADLKLDVFLCWEYYYGWAHFLTYGLGREWLLDNPDLFSWEVTEYFDRVHADGGWIVHAHPFREKIEHVHLFPGKVDAVEVVNTGRDDQHNRYALDYAVSFNLPRTMGSDTHSIHKKRLAGVSSQQPLVDGNDYMRSILAGELELFQFELPEPEIQ